MALVGVAALSALPPDIWYGGPGDRRTAGDWTPNTIPNAIDARATFNSPEESVRFGVHLVGAPYTIGTLNLDGEQDASGDSFYGGALIVQVGAGQARINVQTDASTGEFGSGGAVTPQLNSTTNINATEGAAIRFASDAQITGAGGLVLSGLGTATLAGANTYMGSASISGGTPALLGTGSIATSSGSFIAAGGTFDTSQASAGGMDRR
jgi:autotransporter-associated beta strand protein